MGATIKRAIGEDNRTNGHEINGERERSSSSTTTETTEETRGRSGRSGDSGSSRTTDGEKEKVIPRLVNVDEQKKKDERNAKRRERYAQKKAENGGTVKPRKVNTKKANVEVGTAEQIKSILGTVSGIVASRPNMTHWQLTPQELESISNPLSNILAKSNLITTMGEHSDAIALVTACTTILVPRAIITISQVKEKKKYESKGVKTSVSTKSKPNESRKNNATSTNNDPRNAPSSSNDNQVESWFGSSLSF